MPQEVITVTDPLALTVLQQAVERKKRLLRLSIAQTESKIAAFEAQFGAVRGLGCLGRWMRWS